MKLYMFRTVLLSISRSLFTVHSAMIYVIQALYTQLSSRTWSYSKAVYKPVWHIPFLSVQSINSWWWTEKLSETFKFSCQNKFVKLVHLVFFIIIIFTYSSLLNEKHQPATDVILFSVSFAQPLLNVTQSPALTLYSLRQPQSCSRKIHQN
jgi:hypothetical protein